MTMTEDQLITLLRENGYKVTPQRLAICNYVLSSEIHPTAEQTHSEISKVHPTISMNTIYHTMSMLTNLGLVHELQFDSSSRYDPNTSLHVNVICQKCKRIWDYQSENISDKWKDIVKEIGIDPTGQRLDLYIICDDCNK